MLKQRVITALVLLAVLLPALLARSPWPFAVVTLLLVAAAGWEWGRLNGAGQAASLALGGVVVVGAAAAWSAGWVKDAPALLWWVVGWLWLLSAALLFRRGPASWLPVPQGVRLLLGILVLGVAWLAMAQSRKVGINFVLSVMVLVWVADIAAYFGGKTWGRHKLARSISPGKTWEGAISGAVAVLLLALLWVWIDTRLPVDSTSLYTQLVAHWGWSLAVLALLTLSAMSVVGDLFESLVKRAVGAKDSSRLLPGHGGVLDRIDALLPVFPWALALAAV